jgi:pyruvate/2-oxoglutarate/acetoin dehydrogenase E1 component
MATVLESLNSALHEAFAADDRVVLLGQDVLDPYGGAFKVTRGLSSAYPGRVWTTPVSEAGIVGIGTGLAMRGLRPVVEIMFGDFLSLSADQIINHAAKFRWMYNEQVRVPLVIRTPMGGRRGYGPTHSQTLEKLFMGVPGLTILAPCALGNPGELLQRTILEGDDPCLFIENKTLYSAQVQTPESLAELSLRTWLPPQLSILHSPAYLLRLRDAPAPIITLATYGYMADLARQAAHLLAYEHEIFIEIVVLTQLAPFQIIPVVESTRTTGRLLVIEEGNQTMGWGAEVIARVVEGGEIRLKNIRRLGAKDLPVAASEPLEVAILPGIDAIVQAVRKMV